MALQIVTPHSGEATLSQRILALKSAFEGLHGAVDGRVWSELGSEIDEALTDIEFGTERRRVLDCLREDYLRVAAGLGVVSKLSAPESDRLPMNFRWARKLIEAGPPGNRTDVKCFRREFLSDQLLDPLSVGRWIRARADDQTEVSRSLGVRVILRYFAPTEAEPDRLSLFSHSVGVFELGPLGQLKRVVVRLARVYGWYEAFAVHFVLSGLLPPPQEGRRGPVEPPVSTKQALLAVFVAERKQGRTWVNLMAEWNETSHEFRYTKWRNFARDAREAYEKVERAPLLRRKGRDITRASPAEQALFLAESALESKLANIHPATGESVLKGKDRARSEAELEDVRQRQAKLEQALASV